MEKTAMASTTNREVANILDSDPTQKVTETKPEPAVKIDDAAWGEDDEIEIDDDVGGDDVDISAGGAESQQSDIFVPPQPGPDTLKAVVAKNPQNAALQAAAGEFRRAAEILKS